VRACCGCVCRHLPSSAHQAHTNELVCLISAQLLLSPYCLAVWLLLSRRRHLGCLRHIAPLIRGLQAAQHAHKAPVDLRAP
jgi:hypothetical protein